MWLTRYHVPTEITYEQGSEFMDHEFIKSLIEFGIISKPSTSGNQTSSAILEHVHQFLGHLVQTYNIKETYVYEVGLWLDILESESFEILST